MDTNQEEADALNAKAQAVYPFLANNEYNVVKTGGGANTEGYLEYLSKTETGAPGHPRDPGLPLGTMGLDIYSDEVRPLDLAADIYSHGDATGVRYREEMMQSLRPEQHKRIAEQYEDAKVDPTRANGEFHAKRNGVDALMRTAVLGQGGPRAAQGLGALRLSADQLNTINKGKAYVTSGNVPADTMYTTRTALGLE